MKDGPEGEVIVSRLHSFDLILDDEGDPITSCVMIPVEEHVTPGTRSPKNLSAKQIQALKALTETLLNHGMEAPASFGLPGRTNAVDVSLWRTEMFSQGVLDREASNPR